MPRFVSNEIETSPGGLYLKGDQHPFSGNFQLQWFDSFKNLCCPTTAAWYRITECSGLEGTSVSHLVQPRLQQAAQDHVQAGLEYLQRRRLHNLPGQPVPVLHHPQREEVLPHVQLELPVLQFVPIAPCPVTGHHWKGSGPILLTPTLEIFVSVY